VQEQVIFWGCKKFFVRFSPNLPEKLLCDKRSPYKFSVAVSIFFFLNHIVIDLKIENLVLEFCFLIIQLGKCTLGCARALSKAIAGSVL